MAPAPMLVHQSGNWGRTFVGNESVCSSHQALQGGSICDEGGGRTTDTLLQRSKILLSIHRLFLSLELIQSTSHFGPPQPAPGPHPGWQSPPGWLLHWVPSPSPHLGTPPCAPLCWRPVGIREMKCHKGRPRDTDTYTSHLTQVTHGAGHTDTHAHREPHAHTQEQTAVPSQHTLKEWGWKLVGFQRTPITSPPCWS